MAKCSREGCARLAEVSPKLVIPYAVGMPFNPNRDYAILLGIKVCRRCAAQITPSDQAKLPNVAAFIRTLARAQAKKIGSSYQEPDFDRAKIERVKLNSDEYNRVAPRLELPPAPVDELPFEKLVSTAISRDGKIVEGFRSHYELRSTMDKGTGRDHGKSVPGDVEGFFTSAKRFVGRAEAKQVALIAGQIPPEWAGVRRELLSSDVNW
jgi:hypothetical protein